MRRARLPFVSLIAVIGLAWGCSSAPPRAPRAEPRTAPRPADAQPSRPPAVDAVAGRVVEIARSLLATPYRYAGDNPGGFDCSGLTSYVFGQVGVSLPRTAQTQASAGSWVAPDELAPGDLVFFGDQRARLHHVGVVVSHPGEPLEMIHSSSSRGVVKTAILTNSYWLPRLRFGRRVLPAK